MVLPFTASRGDCLSVTQKTPAEAHRHFTPALLLRELFLTLFSSAVNSFLHCIVTRHVMSIRYRPKYRDLSPALLCTFRTSWCERTPLWHLQRAWRLALQKLNLLILITIYIEYRVQQRLCIWMPTAYLEILTVQKLYDPAKIHNCNSLCHTAYQRQIVTDKNTSHVLFPDKLHKKLAIWF